MQNLWETLNTNVNYNTCPLLAVSNYNKSYFITDFADFMYISMENFLCMVVLSFYLYLYLSVYLSIDQSIYPSTYLSIRISIYLSINNISICSFYIDMLPIHIQQSISYLFISIYKPSITLYVSDLISIYFLFTFLFGPGYLFLRKYPFLGE